VNKDDRRSIKAILQDLEEKKSVLEELQEDLESRSINLDECFPGKAEILTSEADQVCDSISSLEDVIRALEELI